jgi:hypothetical protein
VLCIVHSHEREHWHRRADFAMHNAILTLRGRVAWTHDFTPDRTVAATFQVLDEIVVSASCAYRKSNPGILMVQSAQNRATENASNCLGGT